VRFREILEKRKGSANTFQRERLKRSREGRGGRALFLLFISKLKGRTIGVY